VVWLFPNANFRLRPYYCSSRPCSPPDTCTFIRPWKYVQLHYTTFCYRQSKMRPSFDASELPRLVFINESQRYDKSNYNCALSPRSNEASKLGKNVDTQNASSGHNDHADRDLKAKRPIALVRAHGEDDTEKLQTTTSQNETRDSTSTAS
jgi:hypothetical protein